MRTLSSTSNSSVRRRRCALPWVILGIVVVELIGHRALVGRFGIHEVDAVLRLMPQQPRAARIALLGDSVGFQVLVTLVDRDDFAMLATNQAIEMTGHFYLLRRYLHHAAEPPRAIVFLGHPPLGRNLDQLWTENYVQRCFLNWNEIAEIGAVKRNPVFTSKMIAYKLLATLRARRYLQIALAKSTNVAVDTRPPDDNADQTRHGLMDLLGRWISSFRKKDISDDYFERLLDLSDRIGAEIYYIPAPVSEARDVAVRARENEHIEALARRTPNLHYVADLYRVYPGEHFIDGVHLKKNALLTYRQEIVASLEQLIEANEW